MSSLADILLAAHHRDELIADAARLVEAHVQQRGGLKGMGLKTGLALLKAAKPDILVRASSRMLPDMVQALEPLYQEFRRSGTGDFAVFLDRRADTAVELLLGVADAKVAAAHNAAAKSVYQKFRGGAVEEVRALLPRIGKLVSAYL
jgi:hypothetical protein